MKRKKRAKTVILIGILIGLFAGGIYIGYAINSFTNRSNAVDIDFEKNHTTAITLDVPTEGGMVEPGTKKTISATVKNTSRTDSAYVFIEMNAGANGAWTIKESSWEQMGDSDIYAYASGGEMVPVGVGESCSFDSVLELTSVTDDYQDLSNSDLTVSITAYAVNCAVSRDSISDAWEDYDAGGNGEMIERLDK